eukprot:651587-Amphidinium_carterae.2
MACQCGKVRGEGQSLAAMGSLICPRPTLRGRFPFPVAPDDIGWFSTQSKTLPFEFVWATPDFAIAVLPFVAVPPFSYPAHQRGGDRSCT